MAIKESNFKHYGQIRPYQASGMSLLAPKTLLEKAKISGN